MFIDNITANRSSRINCVNVYRAILAAKIQPIAAKLSEQHFMVQVDNYPNDPKQTA